MIRVAVDLMGSDVSPEYLFQGAIAALNRSKESLSLVLIATREVVERLSSQTSNLPNIQWVEAAEVIEMGESPIRAVKGKPQASMTKAVGMVKKGMAEAAISSGNTGALFYIAYDGLGCIERVERPALTALVPTRKGSMALVDAGANVQCRPDHLIQFAFLGALFQKYYLGVDRPKVGLLNIGSESSKGTQTLKQTYDALKSIENPPYEFIGNIEGREAFYGEVDVLVADGLIGNIFLKTAEGASEFLLDTMAEVENPTEQLQELKRTFHKQFDYSYTPGAVFCGVQGIVIKCHGDGKPEAITNAVLGAVRQAKVGIVEKMKEEFPRLMSLSSNCTKETAKSAL